MVCSMLDFWGDVIEQVDLGAGVRDVLCQKGSSHELVSECSLSGGAAIRVRRNGGSLEVELNDRKCVVLHGFYEK